MNRRYTAFSQSKISGEPKPPSSPKGSRAAVPAMSTANWPGAPGPKGPTWRSGMKGFVEIREGAKQDKADDFSGSGMGKGAMSGAAMGTSIMPGWGTFIGAVAGGLLGAFTGGDEKKDDEEGGGGGLF